MPRFVSSGVKAKNFKKGFKKLALYLKGSWMVLIIAAFLVVFSTICRLIGPDKLGEITDIINPINNAEFNLKSVLKI